MPRVFVTTDHHGAPEGATVLLSEQVASVHLSTGHAASQLIERLAWAISDAEDAEGGARTARRPTRVVAALVPAPAAATSASEEARDAGSSRRGAAARRFHAADTRLRQKDTKDTLGSPGVT